jgi:hypothetical protein
MVSCLHGACAAFQFSARALMQSWRSDLGSSLRLSTVQKYSSTVVIAVLWSTRELVPVRGTPVLQYAEHSSTVVRGTPSARYL